MYIDDYFSFVKTLNVLFVTVSNLRDHCLLCLLCCHPCCKQTRLWLVQCFEKTNNDSSLLSLFSCPRTRNVPEL
jgi:hypothetical protein